MNAGQSDFPNQEFDHTQASLVYINSCFSLSFASLFVLAGQALKNLPDLTALFWLPLPTFLTLATWQKYQAYYIPLQFYRKEPEQNGELATTYFITLFLGLVGVACVVR